MMTLREIKPEDNAAIESIMRACFREFGLPTKRSSLEDTDVSKMYQGFQVERAIYYVVESEGNVVGGGGIKQLNGGEKTICELQKMYFHPEARGKGFGKLLFDKCMQAAKDFGFEHCYLESHSELKTAIKLYEKNGFVQLDNPLGNTGHLICGVWMIKHLL